MLKTELKALRGSQFSLRSLWYLVAHLLRSSVLASDDPAASSELAVSSLLFAMLGRSHAHDASCESLSSFKGILASSLSPSYLLNVASSAAILLPEALLPLLDAMLLSSASSQSSVLNCLQLLLKRDSGNCEAVLLQYSWQLYLFRIYYRTAETETSLENQALEKDIERLRAVKDLIMFIFDVVHMYALEHRSLESRSRKSSGHTVLQHSLDFLEICALESSNSDKHGLFSCSSARESLFSR